MATDHEPKPDLGRIEHKLDLLLRLQGLTPAQIEEIVQAKDASAAQQALIDKYTVKKTTP